MSCCVSSHHCCISCCVMIPVRDEGAPLGCLLRIACINRLDKYQSCLSRLVIAVESKTTCITYLCGCSPGWLIATSHATPRGPTSKAKRNEHILFPVASSFQRYAWRPLSRAHECEIECFLADKNLPKRKCNIGVMWSVTKVGGDNPLGESHS